MRLVSVSDVPFSYQLYILRDDGEMDKFSAPEKEKVMAMAREHSTKYSIVDTIKEENRTVYVARGSVE